MRNFITISIVLLAITGCGDPKDIVLGPEPLKQMTAEGEQFRKLTDEERTLFSEYLFEGYWGSVHGRDGTPVAGKTVGEVLGHARAWKEKIEADKKAADAQDTETLAERKAIAKEISENVSVAMIGKSVLPKNYKLNRFTEILIIKYAIKNVSDRKIRQIKGRVIFKDLSGDDIGWLPVEFDKPVKAGKTLTTTGDMEWEINECVGQEIVEIAGTKFAEMKATFEPELLLFDDGEILEAPYLPD